MNLAKNHDFKEFSFPQKVNGGQQILTKVALLKNMMSQLSKTGPGIILSLPEQFKVAYKNTTHFMYKIMYKSIQKFVYRPISQIWCDLLFQ